MSATHPTTLAQALARAADTGRGVTLIRSRSAHQFIAYSELAQRALGVLRILNEHGVRPGAELIICSDDLAASLDGFWAAVLGGIVPAPLAFPGNPVQRDKVLRVFAQLANPWLLTTRRGLNALLAQAGDSGLAALAQALPARSVLLDDIPVDLTPADPHPVESGDIAFIQFSSGSTGDPKGVVLTHANLVANMTGIIERSAMTADDLTLGWMPLTHDMGLIGFHLTPVMAGAGQILMPTDLFVRRPAVWLETASAMGATILSAPNFGYQHYLRLAKQPAELDLSRVRLIYNGAEPISAAVCQEFTAAMAPFGLAGNSMYPVYGLAEASLAVCFPEPGAALNTIAVARGALGVGDTLGANTHAQGPILVGVGAPIPGAEISIRDAQGVALPDAHVGHVWIRGANVTGKYYGRPADPMVFRGEGWLDTGDLGARLADQVYITGRAKDLIIVNGENHYPHDLEELLERELDWPTGRIAAVGVPDPDSGGDGLLVFCQFKGAPGEFAPTARAVRRVLAQRAELTSHAVLPVARLPRTTSGKPRRFQLAQEWLGNAFADTLAALESDPQPAGLAPEDAVESTLTQICESVLGGQPVAPDANLFELGTSSLKLAQIHEKVDELWPGRLDIGDFLDCPSIRELAARLRELH